jgi:Ca2+-binding EF-hand superfamily protein
MRYGGTLFEKTRYAATLSINIGNSSNFTRYKGATNPLHTRYERPAWPRFQDILHYLYNFPAFPNTNFTCMVFLIGNAETTDAMKTNTTALLTALALGTSLVSLTAQDGNNNNNNNNPPQRRQGGQPGQPGQPGGPQGGPQGDQQGRPQGGPGRDGFRPPPHPVTTALDANNDGTIDADEIKNAVAALKKLDKNNDGKLSDEELRPTGMGMGRGPGGFGGPGGQRGPGGQDGQRGPGGQDGQRGPGGQDGQRGPGGQGGPDGQRGPGGQGGFGGGPNGQGPGGPGGFGRPPGGNPTEFVARIMGMDKNNDGKVAVDELPEQMQRSFDRMDANKDGFADKAEVTAFAEKMRAEGGQGGPGGYRPDGQRGPGRPGAADNNEAPRRPARPAEDTQ